MDNLIGFNAELNLLVNKYNSNNLHNSIIIYGQQGIGKRFFINKLVESMLGSSFKDNNLKHHINLFKNNTHPNIKIVERQLDIKTKKIKSNITIDQIRFLKKFINETSSINNFCKIIIIDAADDLNNSSANSFLKTLEEPSNNTYILLISHKISSILPTVRSRCFKLKLPNHNYDNFMQILNYNLETSEDDTKFLYDITQGSPGEAINLYDSNVLELYNITINYLSNNELNTDNMSLSNILSTFDNDKFKNYLSILKSSLIILNKFKINNQYYEKYLSKNYMKLESLSKSISLNKIINKLEFLSNNEKDLFTFNLDKRMFILNMLIS